MGSVFHEGGRMGGLSENIWFICSVIKVGDGKRGLLE